MRKILSLLFPLALSISGCNLEYMQDQQLNLQEERIFTASFEQNETRTYVENGNLLRWNAGDQISLFDGNTLNRQYQFDGETGDNSGTFSIVNAPYGSGNDLNANYAIYPYASNIKITEAGVITVSVPAEQNYAENSFGLGANTMVAVTENLDDTFLKFKNVSGYLKLQLYGDDVTVKSIALTGNSNEKIAGKSSIIPTYNDEPQISMSDDAASSITLSCGKGVKIGSTAENATDFWIVIPPTTFEGGFTITITDINDETFTKSTSNEIAIERNVIKPMKAFEVIFENETEDEGSSNDYIDEYGIKHGKGVEIDGVIWAPVNCGYHATDFKYGKLYQWGRKYGQGYAGPLYNADGVKIGEYSDATVPTIKQELMNSTTGNSESNSNIFFYHPNYQYLDWSYPQDETLWNPASLGVTPIKSEYDPCPKGWRVPTRFELNALSENCSSWTMHEEQVGIWFSGETSYSTEVPSIFLPAAGFRDKYGETYSRGFAFKYWSSAIYSNTSVALIYFRNDYLSITAGIGRVEGYSVRCVQE